MHSSFFLSVLLLFPLSSASAAPKAADVLVTKKTPGYQAELEINIEGAKELFLEVNGGGNGTGYDWADWIDPRLVAADGSELPLTKLKWTAAEQNGRTFINKNQAGGPLKVNGRAVTGIGTHAEGLITYDLPGGFILFRSGVGLDDGGVNQPNSRPSVEFQVYTEARLRELRPLNAEVQGGFQAEVLYEASLAREGSWVALCVDHRGRLITSDRQGSLYRITLPPDGVSGQPPKVEPLKADVGRANGLLDAFGSLYVVGIGSGSMKGRSGLFRLTDTDKDDQYEKAEHLMPLQVGSDHHAHAVILSPDGKRLVILCGNNTDLPKEDGVRHLVSQQEDHLLPRSTYYGHNTGRKAPGGFVVSCAPDGTERRVYCAGFRNPYDIAFNGNGDLFTFDADMEYDVGGPWYRATRVNHCVSGGEYGWRWGAGKWPDYYPDTFGTTVDIGRGSPTGVVFGYGARFPARYQRALYVLDWTYGKIYAVHLKPKGGTYEGEFETFISGKGMPVSDIVIHPDGAMYYVTGGRRSSSKLVRVKYTGPEDTDPVKRTSPLTREMKLRREIEAFHGDPPDTKEVMGKAIEGITSTDRAVRYAGRTLLEHLPLSRWEEPARRFAHPLAAIESAIALARRGETKHREGLEQNLARLDFAKLATEQRLDLLRAYGLIFTRLGEPGQSTRLALVERFSPHYPSGDTSLDRELCVMLLYLNAPGAVSRSVQQLLSDSSQAGQMFYAYHLRTIKEGWSNADLQAYFGWIQRAEANRGDYTGGGHFVNYLKMIRREAVTRLTEEQKKVIAAQLEAKLPAVNPVMVNRRHVADWKASDLEPALARLETGRTFIRGKRLYEGLCATCHLFNGKGGALGPDLSSVGGRYDAKTFLTEILEPSKVISDQHASVAITLKDGTVVVGREVGGDDAILNMAVNPLDPEEVRQVEKSEIVKREVSRVSLMPPGLLNTLNEEEVLDLMMYLSSGGKVGHTAFQK